MLLVSSKICTDGIVEEDQLIVENLHLWNITGINELNASTELKTMTRNTPYYYLHVTLISDGVSTALTISPENPFHS